MIFCGVAVALAQSILDQQIDASMRQKLPHSEYQKWRGETDKARAKERRHYELLSALRDASDRDCIGHSHKRSRLYKTARLFGAI